MSGSHWTKSFPYLDSVQSDVQAFWNLSGRESMSGGVVPSNMSDLPFQNTVIRPTSEHSKPLYPISNVINTEL